MIEDTARFARQTRRRLLATLLADAAFSATLGIAYLILGASSTHRLIPVLVGTAFFGSLGTLARLAWQLSSEGQAWTPRRHLIIDPYILVGTFVGVLSYFFVNSLTGSIQPANTSYSNALYALVAFIFGYRAQTIADLMHRAADIILTIPASDTDDAHKV
jgi:drug/metabolite transporter (DMT)-like permease